MVCDGYSHVSLCRSVWYVMVTAMLVVCRSVWYVMVTAMIVYVGLYGM